MAYELTIKTGNDIVDEVGTLNFTGNIIPESWYTTIVSKTGKTNSLAILILSDIVYWYRPSEIRNESGMSVHYEKRFSEDLLQRSYEQLCTKFNITKKQARDCIVFLEELGVIKIHFRKIESPNGPLPNVMYLELIPAVLKQLTFPFEDKGIYKNVDTSLQIDKDVPTNTETRSNNFIETNTKTTTKNTTETTTTTAPVVDENTHSLFASLKSPISDSDINAILKEAKGNQTICLEAINYINRYNGKIDNVVGFMISFIRNGGYSCIPHNQSPEKSDQTYTQHNYNMPYLEWCNNHVDDDSETWFKNVEELLGYSLSEKQRNDIPGIHRLIERSFEKKRLSGAAV